MKNSVPDLYNLFFSHIYIEREVRNHPVTKRIIERFPKAVPVEINHYKDVFCRSRQNFRLQKQTPCLILAKKQQNPVYAGAPVCQDFGNRHFYYTSSVMNCVYDCEYCYLQGMYPSANIVVFVNLEEIFEEIKTLLNNHPVYLCVSYDTDLLAIEHVLGYTKEWISFAKGQPDLTIEVRTKSADIHELDRLQPSDNIIFAWTLSPERITKSIEHNTPSFLQRLVCIQKAVTKGFQVRLCFDPIIYCSDWKEQYREMVNTVFENVSPDLIKDASIGVFRAPQDYLKKMRKQSPHSAVIQYPFENDKGVYHYSKELTDEMISFIFGLINSKIPKEKIFIWDKQNI